MRSFTASHNNATFPKKVASLFREDFFVSSIAGSLSGSRDSGAPSCRPRHWRCVKDKAWFGWSFNDLLHQRANDHLVCSIHSKNS